MVATTPKERFVFHLLALLLPAFALTEARLGAQSNASASGTDQAALLDLPEGERPSKVSLGFHLLAINSIDDEAETFKFSGMLTLGWKDSRQGFDPAEAGVEEKFYHGAFQFDELSPAWYPQVILANATDVDDFQGVLLRVRPDGTSTLVQTITAEVRSQLNLRSYPFDRQRLEATFMVLGFDDSEVVLSVADGAIIANLDTIQVPQWDLTGINAVAGSAATAAAGASGRAPIATLNLDVERQSFFMVRLVIMPLILMVVLSWSVFWMDRSSLGDRMSVSFVGILTAVAYQIMVSDIMPHISYLTLMNSMLNFSFLVMCATVFINLIVGALDKRGEIARGESLDYHCRRVFPLIYAILLAASVLIFSLLL